MSTPGNSAPLPHDPREFLAAWTASRGNLRNFLETQALAPLGESEQKAAGEAAAATAAGELFGLELTDFSTGVDSVIASLESHGIDWDTELPQQLHTAAFFDVDNTLIQGSSLVLFAMGLARKRYLKLGEILPVAWKQIKFRVSGSENSKDVASGRTQALEFIKGRRVDEIVQLCEEIVENSMADKVYSGTLELAQKHIDAGEQVWLVTATPVQIAQILARRYGFTGALGTVAETKDGKFTGNLVGDILHGPGKSHAVAALATIEHLDLNNCTAYSDSANDVPMLSMVGNAVAINPDGKLRKLAQEREWTIYDYRSLRRAVRSYGIPALVTAAASYGSWRFLKPGRWLWQR